MEYEEIMDWIKELCSSEETAGGKNNRFELGFED